MRNQKSGPVKKPEIFWALLQVYRPFTMGGSANQEYRYETAGTPLVVGRVKFFAVARFGRVWIHELKTGGAVCSDKTFDGAKKLLKALIAKHREDFLRQIKELGSVLQHAVMSEKDAMKELKKSFREEGPAHG